MEIEKLRTANGGYRRADLERLGVEWPPKKGWLKRLKAQLPPAGQEQLARENRERQAKRHADRKARKAAAKAVRKVQQEASPKKPKTRRPKPKGASVYKSEAWKRVRYEVLCEQKSTCQLCGTSPKEGAVMNVDHIQPVHSHPHLALEKSNLRVLCASCNWGKGGREPERFEEEFRIPWERFEKF